MMLTAAPIYIESLVSYLGTWGSSCCFPWHEMGMGGSIGLTLVLATGAWEGLVRSFSSGKRNRLNQALHSFFSFYEIEQATQHYIPTRFDQFMPEAHAEAYMDGPAASRLLIPYFIEKGFLEDKLRFFLVLGDAEIGKTTFLLNLFHAHVSKRWEKQHILLLSLSKPSSEAIIHKAPNKDSTILLLDGLDKDPKALDNYERRLKELQQKTQAFKKVVITCRKEFFSREIIQPMVAYMEKKLADAPQGELACIQLSPFNEKEIARYLRQKYPLWQLAKRNQANRIKQLARHMIKYPLVLAHIEELLEDNPTLDFAYSHEMYKALVEAWMKREAQYWPDIKQDALKSILFGFVKAIAVAIYRKQQEGGGLYLGKEALQVLAQEFQLQLESLTIDEQSLINYDSNWDYRFIHKSIMEYLLAVEAHENPAFFEEISFAGFDQCLKFYRELFLLRHTRPVPAGKLALPEAASEEDSKGAQQVAVEAFYMGTYPVTVKAYRIYCEQTKQEMPPEPSWGWEEAAPVINLSWKEAQDYCKWLGDRMCMRVRLPLDKEWEYAARGAKNRIWEFAGSDDIDEVAWYNKNSHRKTQPVGTKKPNELGIHDMSGLVWEWCEESTAALTEEGEDSQAPKNRVIRGGSWLNHLEPCYIRNRGFSPEDRRSITIGFRYVIEKDDP